MANPDATRRIASAYHTAICALMESMPVEDVARLAALIVEVARAEGVVYVFGNGGSAATAIHMSCDLTKNTRVPGAPSVRCLCLSATMPLFSAFGNDEGYAQVFAGPLRALGRAGDLALALSASGNSPNVLEALRAARALGMRTAALLGCAGGEARALCDLPLVVASDFVPQIEDAHLIINHVLTECVRDLLRAHLPLSPD